MNPFEKDKEKDLHIFFQRMTEAINGWMLEKYPTFDTRLTHKIESLSHLQKQVENECKSTINKMLAEKDSLLKYFKEEINKFLSQEYPGVSSRLSNLAGDLEVMAKKLNQKDEEIGKKLKKVISSDSAYQDIFKIRDEMKVLQKEWEVLSKKLKSLFK